MLLEGSKIAVLIDGDNAEAALVDQILNEASKFGRVTIKRIYADFTTQQMNAWKERLNAFAIRPVQKFAYTKGKNSTDSALIIDAMDIMHSKLVDGFCIVSSDSDYTGIAHRIREEGMFVMGIGKAHTPEAFVKACDNFTYTEILLPSAKKADKAHKKEKNTEEPETKRNKRLNPKDVSNKGKEAEEPAPVRLTNLVTHELIDMSVIEKAFEMVYDRLTGMALASRMSSALKKVDPTFDIRNYGHNSFRKFLEALSPRFSVLLHKDGQTLSVKRGE